MSERYRFDRLELAGSLGDLGTLLPISIGMVLINGIDPLGLFWMIGVFYVLSGLYYGVTVPVQPMKVIGAYVLATAMTPGQITASAVLIGLILIVIGGTGAVTLIGKYTPKPVIRGVQLTTGVMLMAEGIRFMIGTSSYQVMRGAAEPFLAVQAIGPVPIGVIVGLIGGGLTLFLLDNRKIPAGLVVVVGGLIFGAIAGNHDGFESLRLGLHLPAILPYGLPAAPDFSLVLLVLVLPQLPMTLGNAVIANADLSREYFGDGSKRVTYRALCISMGLANIASFLFGGMPLCHGAGGLAAHYRFGARTAGSNLMIGAAFMALALFLGSGVLAVISLIPMAVLGVLLLFAGGQLALTLLDVTERKDLFAASLVLGITLATNLAIGFVAGLAVAYALKWDRLKV